MRLSKGFDTKLCYRELLRSVVTSLHWLIETFFPINSNFFNNLTFYLTRIVGECLNYMKYCFLMCYVHLSIHRHTSPHLFQPIHPSVYPSMPNIFNIWCFNFFWRWFTLNEISRTFLHCVLQRDPSVYRSTPTMSLCSFHQLSITCWRSLWIRFDFIRSWLVICNLLGCNEKAKVWKDQWEEGIDFCRVAL